MEGGRIDQSDQSKTRGKSEKRRFRGGKALQRLIYYLGNRNPELSEEALARIPVPRGSLPRFEMPDRPSSPSAPQADARAAPVGVRTRSPAKDYAANILETAQSLSAATQAMAAAPGAAPPAAWQFLGPTRIPNGQTYGTNRVDVIGRVGCIAIDPQQPNHLLCGAAGGGIWESHDLGAS